MEARPNSQETAPLLGNSPRSPSASFRPPLLRHRTISSLSLSSTQQTAEEQTRSSFHGLLILLGLIVISGIVIVAWNRYSGRTGGLSLPNSEAPVEPLECSLPPETVGEGELPEFVPYPYDD
ncbi:hypothetical protein A1Q2_02457 [Trichosporon asahii var. asahii CBS 8904]|uniref:Uncharacterized protein n=1 Tax=Trichosporon asahii var. asahii (strain CBS 8904) TaxID=1220162 RepID=K1VRN1_TRIAC|nr:hypothetical protein A1Q2_02457 [Trichosporon asahii var. asahii CBS 8904]